MKKINFLLIVIISTFFITNLNAKIPVKECIEKKLETCNGLTLNPKLFHITQERFDRISKSVKDYKERCNNKKFGLSCLNLAHMYRTGNTLKKDLEKVMQYYTKAYKYGNPMGYRFIAYMYEKGDLVEKDINQALKYFEMGCKNKDKYSCKRLNLIKKNIQTQKELKEIEEIDKLCDNGEIIKAKYCDRIGTIYEGQNKLEKAIKYYKKGCNSIFQLSCSKLGELYISNTQLHKNFIKGIDYLKVGCENGLYKDCLKIGDFFKENLPKNPISKKYYQKACSLGYKEACDFN